MKKLLFDEARKNWLEIGHHKKPGDLKLEVELYKKMLNIFQVGDFYYMVFNPPEGIIEYTSSSITPILGYEPSEFRLEMLMEIIHPDDLPYFLDFETTVTRFWKQLPPEKVMKYKSRYDYRLRKKNGEYMRILQQIVTIQSDEHGAVLRTFVVHTDISHIKRDHKMMLSFVGLEGEPSYIDVQPDANFSKSREVLTSREKEVLYLISQDYSSEAIGRCLNISPKTVGTHRKNIYRKTGTHTVTGLIKLALQNGWL